MGRPTLCRILSTWQLLAVSVGFCVLGFAINSELKSSVRERTFDQESFRAQMIAGRIEEALLAAVSKGKFLIDGTQQKFKNNEEGLEFLKRPLVDDPRILSVERFRVSLTLSERAGSSTLAVHRKWEADGLLTRPKDDSKRIRSWHVKEIQDLSPLSLDDLRVGLPVVDGVQTKDGSRYLRVALRVHDLRAVVLILDQKWMDDLLGNYGVFIVDRTGSLLAQGTQLKFARAENLRHLNIVNRALSSDSASERTSYTELPGSPELWGASAKIGSTELVVVSRAVSAEALAAERGTAIHLALWFVFTLLLVLGLTVLGTWNYVGRRVQFAEVTPIGTALKDVPMNEPKLG